MVFNPGKRNRNFGTKKRGHGQDNRHVIPWVLTDSWAAYYAQLTDYVTFEVPVWARTVRFIVEVPRPDMAYAVTPEDVVHLLSKVEQRHVKDVDLFVFRQPTRRQQTLHPVWGRIAYFTEIAEFEGVAIFLEATSAVRTWTRPKSVTPEEAKELGHLEDHTLHARFLRVGADVEEDTAEAERRIDEGTPHYDQKPAAEREVYAHRFSDDRRRELSERGVIPFERRFDARAMAKVAVEAKWFEAPLDDSPQDPPG